VAVYQPQSVAIDSTGNAWVGDLSNNRVQKFNTSGTWLQTIPSSGCQTASVPACSPSTSNGQFSNPQTVAFDSSGNLWVTDSNNNRVEEFNGSGTFLLGIGAGYNGVSGSIGTSGTGSGQFNYSAGIAIGSR
jgi:DNA-binding beta-propeller fold protein YncE